MLRRGFGLAVQKSTSCLYSTGAFCLCRYRELPVSCLWRMALGFVSRAGVGLGMHAHCASSDSDWTLCLADTVSCPCACCVVCIHAALCCWSGNAYAQCHLCLSSGWCTCWYCMLPLSCLFVLLWRSLLCCAESLNMRMQ